MPRSTSAVNLVRELTWTQGACALPKENHVQTFYAETLTQFTEELFDAVGVPRDEANRVARSLVDANLCGHDSHGVIRIVQYADVIRDGRLKPAAAFTVVKETAGILVVDGGWGLGQVQ